MCTQGAIVDGEDGALVTVHDPANLSITAAHLAAGAHATGVLIVGLGEGLCWHNFADGLARQGDNPHGPTQLRGSTGGRGSTTAAKHITHHRFGLVATGAELGLDGRSLDQLTHGLQLILKLQHTTVVSALPGLGGFLFGRDRRWRHGFWRGCGCGFGCGFSLGLWRCG